LIGERDGLLLVRRHVAELLERARRTDLYLRDRQHQVRFDVRRDVGIDVRDRRRALEDPARRTITVASSY
jgi:hypothetical protein